MALNLNQGAQTSANNIIAKRNAELIRVAADPVQVNAINAYAARHGPGSKPGFNGNSPPARDSQDELRGHLFRDRSNNAQFTPTKCRTCFKSRSPMPVGNEIPVGLDPVELCACGCDYEEALLEEWMLRKGLYVPSRVNGTMGREARQAMMSLFEHILGPFTFAKLVDRQARVQAAQAQLTALGRGCHHNNPAPH